MEKLEINQIDASKVVEMYKSIGKTAKQMASLTFEVEETPEAGVIVGIDETPKVYQDNKYFVYKVADPETGEIIGTMSVNRPHDTYVEEGDLIVVGSGANKDKGMLRSHRMNILNPYGKSRAEQIANLIGKKYTSVKQDKNVLISYDPKDMFIEPNKSGEFSETSKKQLWKNNTKAVKLTKFEFSEI